MASLSYQLADKIVEGLPAFIEARRLDEKSWDAIARELSDLTGAFIFGETVRRWASEDAA